jgi:hypothetical protein
MKLAGSPSLLLDGVHASVDGGPVCATLPSGPAESEPASGLSNHVGYGGKLYVAVGENARLPARQNAPRQRRWKRSTGNPFYSQATGVNRSIWAGKYFCSERLDQALWTGTSAPMDCSITWPAETARS